MDSDLYPRDAARDVLRWFAAVLDKAIYGLLGLLYQLFFSVASADIFSSGVISKFYARVQIVIGVFVLFQLAMTILRGIVNPDEFMDSKSGAGNLIMRVCTALVMLALIVPINIPGASNEYEKQINNNGLLFGTLYSLQHRILQNNTIAKVVMGVGDSKDGNGNYMNDMSNEGLKKSSNVFVSTLVKSFYRINLIPEDDRDHPAGKEDDQVVGNRVCPDMDQDVLDEYKKIEADPATIIGFVNKTCKAGNVADKYGAKTGLKSSSKVYAFTFIPLISTLIGILFVLIFAWLTIEIAVRAIKLAILRLLAPVPIISYMDPKGGKDGAFNAWVKTLTSTYLDLFVRVATVYFVIYMIQQMISHGITTSATGALKTWTIIFIFLGLFYFAKEAPKFIKQVLGIKDDGGTGLFAGMGKVLGLGAAAGATAIGAVGAFRASKLASEKADETNDAATTGFKGLMNRGKHLVAGIAGGVAGGMAGATAAINAKDHKGRAAFDAITKRNAMDIARGRSGSTAFGRAVTMGERLFAGQDSYETETARINQLKAVEAAGKDLHSYLEDRGVKKGAKYSLTHTYTDENGQQQTITTTLDEWKNAREIAKQKGLSTFTIDGRTFATYGSTAGAVEGDLTSAAGLAWYQDTGGDETLRQRMDSFEAAGGIQMVRESLGTSYVAGESEFNANNVKTVFKGAGTEASTIERSTGYQKHKADHGATGGNN